MLTYKRIAVVGSREFTGYDQLAHEVEKHYSEEDWLVSGGAVGADSMAQRWAKEEGGTILIHYPRWRPKYIDPNTGLLVPGYDKGAGFKRNKKIVESSDLVLAFYEKGRFREGGTANTASWADKLGVELLEFEQE